MALAQVVYVSTRTPQLTRTVLDSIVTQSATANAVRDITGVLLCCGDHVMQLLEGDLAAVFPLFQRIQNDWRHTSVQLLLCKNIERRPFPEWGMTMADLERPFSLDRERLSALMDAIRLTTDTGACGVEARMLLHDFRQQVRAA
jgi:hypothetical protein